MVRLMFCPRLIFYINSYSLSPALCTDSFQNWISHFVYELTGVGKLTHKNDMWKLTLLIARHVLL